jgi:hypothetical protein
MSPEAFDSTLARAAAQSYERFFVPAIGAPVADALAEHVSPESASFVHAVFSLYDEEGIRRLAADAGFRDVDVRSAPKTLRLPAPAEFLWGYVRSTPLVATIEALDEERRAALERNFCDRCAPHVEGDAIPGSVRMTTFMGRA